MAKRFVDDKGVSHRTLPSDRYKDLISGDLSVSDLDDEELIHGKIRNSVGTFAGRPPNVIPRQFFQAIQREIVGRSERGLYKDLDPMFEVLREVALSPRAAAVARNAAAIYLIERVAGRVPEKQIVETTIRKFETLVEGGSLLMDIQDPKALSSQTADEDSNIEDAEVVEERPKLVSARKPIRRRPPKAK